jgi:hypothetical protein
MDRLAQRRHHVIHEIGVTPIQCTKEIGVWPISFQFMLYPFIMVLVPMICFSIYAFGFRAASALFHAMLSLCLHFLLAFPVFYKPRTLSLEGTL